MEESTISADFTASNANVFVDRAHYDSVSVLMLYWRDGDLNVEDELRQLRKVFEAKYKFRVTSYGILGNGEQQASLRKEVASFMIAFAMRKRDLGIIYYTGHCREFEGRAQWTAKREGGPTLIWSDIQTNCFDATGDVLLILDCCHATLFTKGVKVDGKGRFEVLAACAKGLTTPGPGEGSFTRALLKALESNEVLKQGATAMELRNQMEEHTRETPFWSMIGSKALTSIVIRPLTPPSDPRYKRKPAGYLFLRVSLSDDLDGMRISDWLKTNAPEQVSAVEIEAIVLKARRLQKNLDHNAFPQGSSLRKLDPAAQVEILKHLQYLDTHMVTAARTAQSPLADGDGRAIKDTLRGIELCTNAAIASIETPLLLDRSKNEARETVQNDIAIPEDTLNSISLHERVKALDSNQSSQRSFEIPREKLQFSNSPDRFVQGVKDGHGVVIDFFEYDPDDDGKPFSETIDQLEKISAILCHEKGLGYHILPGLGYIHQRVKNRFGVVFKLDPKHSGAQLPPVTLESLFKNHPRLSLSRRIQIAHAIITAVENLHRVEWIHKEIRSDNICFFPRPKKQFIIVDEHQGADALPDFDIDPCPWLFGFEYARAMTAGTKFEEDHELSRNIYRHPERWDQPKVSFTRYHDVYSLGVVLMEIADWRKIDDIVKMSGRGKLDSIREKMKTKMDRHFPHQIGDCFTETIKACFDFEKRVGGMDEYRMQKVFQDSIVEPFQRIVGLV